MAAPSSPFVRIRKRDAMKLGALSEKSFDERRRQAVERREPIYTLDNDVELHYVPQGFSATYHLRHAEWAHIDALLAVFEITPLDHWGRPIVPPKSIDPQTGVELLRCAECHLPLDRGYCSHCRYAPSAQDTYIGTS